MPVEQMNVSLSPEMAKFVRGKVKTGSYTNASEVVRAALRRLQDDEAREIRVARTAVDAILAEMSDQERQRTLERAREGFAEAERGEKTDYAGREGLERLGEGVKERGRKLAEKAGSSE
jgi:antitoxin ParD1/3/4